MLLQPREMVSKILQETLAGKRHVRIQVELVRDLRQTHDSDYNIEGEQREFTHNERTHLVGRSVQHSS